MNFDHEPESVTLTTPNPDHVLTYEEFVGLAYPEPPAPDAAEPVDPADLPTRDEFVEAATAAGSGLTDETAGCVYDELRTTYPGALLDDADPQGDAAVRSALMAAGMVCTSKG